MTLLNRDAILAVQDLHFEDVQVDEWGGSVRVRVMTGAERDSFGSSLIGADGKPSPDGYKAKLVARCLVDEGGNRMFSDAEVALLASKSAAALDRVFAVADRLNAVSSQSVDAAEKN